MSFPISSALLALVTADVPAEVPLVVQGKPAAVVVTAVAPGAVTAYAAQELVYHVEKATGVRLPIVTENAVPAEPSGRVYIGNCAAARAAGIEPDRLPREAFVLKTRERALFIAGEDSAGDPLDEDTRAGTLWGVYELLERVLKVRWLWPGELGVVAPKTPTVVVGSLDETVPPRFLQRKLRPGLRPGADGAALGVTREASERYAREQQVFLRRHRMGRSQELRYGHAFENWSAKYGEAHPDWFQLLPDGRRGPERPGGRTAMCVSNPAFQDEVIAQWKAGRAARPGAFFNLNACENDVHRVCTCAACRAWDGPQPAGIEKIFPLAAAGVASDRYARFWLALQQRVTREDPEATVVTYAYVNYSPAPTPGIKLNAHIMVGVCLWPGFWYPRTPSEQEWIKQQWAGWRATGARLFTRPNHFLDGYCMPHVFAHQFADEFQFAARNGLAATDFDSLTGQWATQGTNLYLLARLHVRPEAPAEELLGEYYSAFGPAAHDVQAYFDYWERYAVDNRERIAAAVAPPINSRWRQYPRIAHELYPPSAFGPAEAILDRAARAAAGDPEAAARVDFLRKGLTHARLCTKVASALANPPPAADPAARRKALDELIAYRHTVERDNIANLGWLAYLEGQSWDLTGLAATGASRPAGQK